MSDPKYTLAGSQDFPFAKLTDKTAVEGDAPAGDKTNATSALATAASDKSGLDLSSGLAAFVSNALRI